MFGIVGLIITIPLHLIYSGIVSKKETLRADGKKRTGGLLGGAWDEIVMGFKDETGQK